MGFFLDIYTARARFEAMEEEAHQSFQEVPDQWNARVDAFWRQLGSGSQ